MKYIKIIILMAVILLVMTGCADKVSFEILEKVEQVGFWHGLWHGLIAVPAFLCSLFMDEVSIYAIYNNGAWYDLGFVIGTSTSIGTVCKCTK